MRADAPLPDDASGDGWTWAAAGSAGVLLALAAAPLDWAPLAFLFAPLLMWALERDPTRTLGRAFLVGMVAGTLCNAIAFYWIVGLLGRFGELPLVASIPTAALLYVAQALPYGMATLIAALLAGRGVPVWLGLPACLTVTVSVFPALFPWHPSATLVAWLPWVQLAEVGGEPLLDGLLHLGGCALLAGWTGRRAIVVLVGLSCLIGPAAYGAWRIPRVEAARTEAAILRVGVIQANISIEDKYDARQHLPLLELQREMTKAVESNGAELVIWSESAYPFHIPRSRPRDMPKKMAVLGDGVRGPVLFGAITRAGRCDKWNSVLALEPTGEFTGISDKVKLLAFGEFVPFWHWLPPLQSRFRCPGIVAGRAPKTLTLSQTRIGVLNCYEDVLSAYARSVMDDDPEFLVNVTNDAWFGDTTEPYLHHMVARLRSIETRRDLVRAVNTGVSAHTTSTGADAQRTDTWRRATFIADVRRLNGKTIFVRTGDWVTPLVAMGLALLLLRRPRR